jgi:small subunit ribosomal protein S14
LARKSSIEKNNKRKALAKRYAAHRTELRDAAVNMKLSEEARFEARKKLQALPRDTSINRVITRCEISGRLVERRDQVLITFLSLFSIAWSIFF